MTNEYDLKKINNNNNKQIVLANNMEEFTFLNFTTDKQITETTHTQILHLYR